MNFNTGGRVYYVSGSYAPASFNPLKGSKYECQGTVTYTNSAGVGVEWDNGCHNGYLNSDLELVDSLDQNDPNSKWTTKNKRK